MILNNVKDTIQGKAKLGHKRSSKWPKIRKEFLLKNPKCAVCSGTKSLEAHHIIPFHVNPDLELDPNNLVALCESKSYGIICHLLVGHLGNYKNVNPNVKEDVAFWNEKLQINFNK